MTLPAAGRETINCLIFGTYNCSTALKDRLETNWSASTTHSNPTYSPKCTNQSWCQLTYTKISFTSTRITKMARPVPPSPTVPPSHLNSSQSIRSTLSPDQQTSQTPASSAICFGLTPSLQSRCGASQNEESAMSSVRK